MTLPDPTTWTLHGQSLTHERRGWQIVISAPIRVLPEDVPEEIARVLSGIGYRTELNLSPIDAPEAARKFLSRSGIAIARATHGVIFDPQADQLTLPSGIKRFVKPEASENASVLSMSWRVVGGPIPRGEFGRVLDVLETELPEALPRRYGSFEPPEHAYAETGREHFLKFLGEHLRGQVVVWYPSPPVANVHIGLPETIGPSKRGFRCAYFAVDVDASRPPSVCDLRRPQRAHIHVAGEWAQSPTCCGVFRATHYRLGAG
jgi:hypothetical protein